MSASRASIAGALAVGGLLGLDLPAPTPPVHSWAALVDWYATAGPAVAAVALVRGLALVVGAWFLVALALQLLRAVPALAGLGWIADLVSPRSLQRLGHGLAGLSLTALAAPAPSAGTLAEDPPLPPAPAAVAAWPADDIEPGTATMRLLIDEPVPVPEPPPEARPEPPPVAPAPVAIAVDVPDPGLVTVAAGDSLWSLAADELRDRLGDEPSLRALDAYWRQVVAANRDRLVDPSNPDLLYPGQAVVLPPS